jgi:conjugative transfer signal peptidase TraF
MKALAAVGTTLALTAVGLAATAAMFDLRWNWSRSLPMGLYQLDRSAQAIAAGDVVVVCPPADVAALALKRRYLARGSCPEGSQPLLKVVLGFDGEVAVTERGFVVAGQPVPFTEPRVRDSQGRSLDQWQGEGTGVWVAGPNPWSWDSRYWGPVDPGRIVARARRLSLHPWSLVLVGGLVAGAAGLASQGRRRVRQA